MLVDRTERSYQTKCSTSSDCALLRRGELLFSEDISNWYVAGSRGGGAGGGQLRSSSLSPRWRMSLGGGPRGSRNTSEQNSRGCTTSEVSHNCQVKMIDEKNLPKALKFKPTGLQRREFQMSFNSHSGADRTEQV